MKVIYEEKVPVITFVGEPDEAMFKEFKAHGIKIVYRSLNPAPEKSRTAEKFSVMALGEITDSRGFNAAFALGAEGQGRSN